MPKTSVQSMAWALNSLHGWVQGCLAGLCHQGKADGRRVVSSVGAPEAARARAASKMCATCVSMSTMGRPAIVLSASKRSAAISRAPSASVKGASIACTRAACDVRPKPSRSTPGKTSEEGYGCSTG